MNKFGCGLRGDCIEVRVTRIFVESERKFDGKVFGQGVIDKGGLFSSGILIF